MHCRFRAFPICAALFPVGAGGSVSRHRPCCSRPRSSALFRRYAILLHAPPSHIVCPRCDSIAFRVPSPPRRFQSAPCPWVLRHASPCRSHSGLRTSPPCFAAAVPVSASSFCSVHVHSDAALMCSVPCRFRSCLLRSTPSHFSATPRYAVSLPILALPSCSVPLRLKSAQFRCTSHQIKSLHVFAVAQQLGSRLFRLMSSPFDAMHCHFTAFPWRSDPCPAISWRGRSFQRHVDSHRRPSCPCQSLSLPFGSAQIPALPYRGMAIHFCASPPRLSCRPLLVASPLCASMPFRLSAGQVSAVSPH